MSPPSMRLRVRPTTSPTRAACPRTQRYALLDGWLARLRSAEASPRPGSGRGRGSRRPPRQIFHALGATIRDKRLPLAPFEDLLSAFRQDVAVRRYATWDDVLDYSRRSANPVGRLVLRIAGYDDARLDAWADAMCTALQLTNFWQDVKPDYERGRVYLPQQQAAAYSADEADLSRPETSRPWRLALAAAVARTRASVRGRPPAVRRAERPAAPRASRDLAGRHPHPQLASSARTSTSWHAGPASAPSTSAGWRGASPPGCRDEPRHQLLLLVPGAAGRQAARHRRGVGLLPGGGRRRGRSGAGVAARLACCPRRRARWRRSRWPAGAPS